MKKYFNATACGLLAALIICGCSPSTEITGSWKARKVEKVIKE